MPRMTRALSPFRQSSPLVALQQQMDRMLDDLQRGMGMGIGMMPMNEFMPTVDVKEGTEKVQVMAEIPGMTHDDLEITLAPSRDMLILKGEKRQTSQEEREDYYHSECTFGSFRRNISLPCEVDDKNVEARIKNGVLKIELAKRGNGSATSKKIEVRSA